MHYLSKMFYLSIYHIHHKLQFKCDSKKLNISIKFLKMCKFHKQGDVYMLKIDLIQTMVVVDSFIVLLMKYNLDSRQF